MVKAKDSDTSQNESLLLPAVKETSNKISSSLLPSIDDHVSNEKFEQKDGLDFLDAKNGIMISYMIDLTQLLRLKSAKSPNKEEIEACLGRLREMKITLEKIRPLEKKMRYQIDKLLALSASSSAFAAANLNASSVDKEDGGDNDNGAVESSDPLAFRPNPDSMLGKDEDDAMSDNEIVNDSNDESLDSMDDSSDGEDDDELRAAKEALNAGRSKRRNKNDDDDEDDVKGQGVYRAPRLAAVPFVEHEKKSDKEERILKRKQDRLRKSEFLSTLKATFGDAPEEDDFDGGAAVGKQRESARRFAEKLEEKTRHEEDTMMRLTTSRKEKMMRNKMMREEVSNLNSIVDLGNISAGVSAAFGGGKRGKGREELIEVEGRGSSRHSNGKRRRDGDEFGGTSSNNGKVKKRASAKNSFQKALYGMEGGSGKKKKKSGRR